MVLAASKRPLLKIGLAGLLLAACAHQVGPASRVRKAADFVPIPEAEAALVENPHDYKGKPLCQRCHSPGETYPTVDPIGLCSQCHDANLMKHPIAVDQHSGAGSLPLLDGHEVVCHTCHDPHDLKTHPHGLRAKFSALCLNCHKRH